MRNITNILHYHHEEQLSSTVTDTVAPYDIVGLKDFFRYRKQRGVNLGSWFTLERWICDAPFRQAQAPAQSDFDVARGSNAREILEHHWDSWIIEDDWRWLSDHGINTVRIPIGFYHVCGADPSVLHGTDFADLGHVFNGAWICIMKAIDNAHRYGIGVLIDLHAAPGKQNADAHSGQTGPVRFYESQNMSRTQVALLAIAREVHSKVNVVGIQLLNEPRNDGKLPGWYKSTILAISKIDPGLPIYIHDAWNIHQYAGLVSERADTQFIVLDTHVYRCFTSNDHKLSGDEHASVMRNHTQNEFVSYANSSRGNIIVGEFSAALNTASLRSSGAGEQDRQRRAFARAQLDIYEKHCAGWFFWTYKKDGWDAGWCLRDTMTAAIMPDWFGIRRKEGKEAVSDTQKRNAAQEKALSAHTAYWRQYPGHYEHWRFADGFLQGWDDAYLFFSQNISSAIVELGFKSQWERRRIAEYVKVKGSSQNIWEYEHGFNQGADLAMKTFVQEY